MAAVNRSAQPAYCVAPGCRPSSAKRGWIIHDGPAKIRDVDIKEAPDFNVTLPGEGIKDIYLPGNIRPAPSFVIRKMGMSEGRNAPIRYRKYKNT